MGLIMNWDDYCKSNISKLKQQYRQIHSTELNLEHPVMFTEKLQWLKIFDSHMLKAVCADKIKVHQYYKSVLGTDIGIPIIKVYDGVNSITESDIRQSCVIKCNHGSGMNIVLKDSVISLDEVKNRLTKWLSTDHGKLFGEAYYSLIKPTIFAEQYLPDLRDVKVFCFNQKPLFYQIDQHLTEGRMNFYDLDWQPLTWLSNASYPADYTIIDEKPQIDVIYSYAEKLCKPFKFVRCDFVISNRRIYGGELTFIPGAGNQKYIGDGDRRLGDLLAL